MYPTIMVQHNISAETLFCRCCDNHVVPEAGYTICERPHEGVTWRPCSGRSSNAGPITRLRLKEGGIAPEAAGPL